MGRYSHTTTESSRSTRLHQFSSTGYTEFTAGATRQLVQLRSALCALWPLGSRPFRRQETRSYRWLNIRRRLDTMLTR